MIIRLENEACEIEVLEQNCTFVKSMSRVTRVVIVKPISIRETSTAYFRLYRDGSIDVQITDDFGGQRLCANLSKPSLLAKVLEELKKPVV